MDNLDLFDPPRARTTDPETSHQAAASMEGEAAAQRGRILNHLRCHGPLTADALDRSLGLRVTSAGRRLPELKEAGLVFVTEGVGKTRSGRKARAWMATTTEGER